MEFNQFVNEVKGGIKQFLPIEYEDAQVRIEEVKKLNENYLGITVLKENQVIAPTFNLNQLYKMYQSDPEISMGSILRSITELVLDVPEQFNPKSITEYENAKKKLFIRVSSAEKNEEMLQNVPHQMREDLAITYHLAIRIDDIGVGSTTITNDILKRYGISEEQLHADAMENLSLIHIFLFYGTTIIPFKDKFDKSLKLYSLMTTKPEEVEQREKEGGGSLGRERTERKRESCQ